MAQTEKRDSNQLTNEETERRLERALKRSLTMPPKPITPKAKGQPKLKGRKVRPKKDE